MDCLDDSAASNKNPKFVEKSCHVPELGFFISALRTKLKDYFEEVTVQCVDCPDLTQPPYRFVAPGLCGNTGQLITGKFATMYPLPQSEKIYNFKKILRKIKRNKNTFLLGSSLCFSMAPQEVMCTVFINLLFSPKDEEINVTNESRGAFVFLEKDDSTWFRERRSINDVIGYKSRSDNRTRDERKTREKLSLVYALDPIYEQNYTFSSCIINNPDPECVMCGMCFISEGQPGQVLKIHVKKCINKLGFTAALHQSLREIKGLINSPLGLGGTFVMSGGNVTTAIMPKFPPNPLDNVEIIEANFYRKNVATESLVVAGAVTSEYNPYLTFCTFNQYEACGMFDEKNSKDVTEYLGYFSLIENIYEFWHEPTDQFILENIDVNLQARCPDM
ncbi:ester hydrolase C11orf54 homolog [Linepithema humile]|uniref:ester hydrolase C11orf54 homolog n=1 Tax=Linepithema humile TaxID=83485 RepID=UPI0006238BB6|nr:PREDICTED: ester hydrolase C11orf54-like [Linepithema humile]XP_012226537.1 PREDICTED: ester hydrolase C11orf54-like [Linepithema humile]XP_012226538.1 PREDICTED: ester hydrolase C11orf54-like [Linepithema humile]XP_012226539.1 PREDICTED: ester hydrolase C11orf54-like [Linepithema humile]